MYELAQNFRLPLRHLREAPGFTLTVVLVLALGIGSTTAIFSLVEGVLLRPLPFNDAGRLVLVGDHLAGGPGVSVTAREIDTYVRATSAFSSLGGYASTSYELSGAAIPEEINAARLTAGVLPTLGVQPILGRVFTAQEENAHQLLAVISYALWLNRYQRSPFVLGTSIVLDRRVYTIIGVMPRSFRLPNRFENKKIFIEQFTFTGRLMSRITYDLDVLRSFSTGMALGRSRLLNCRTYGIFLKS